MLVFGHDLDIMCLSNLNKLKKKDFKSRRFPYLSMLISRQNCIFFSAYSEKTKSVTLIYYNRFRCISLRTTTMQKFKQIWIYAIWYRPTLIDSTYDINIY
jgi:hypothetical protein